MEITNERDLLELRGELKKFRRTNPKKVLQLLKQIRDCTLINKEWIRKTKVTKTLTRISKHTYNDSDEVRIMIIKLSKHLLAKFRQLFPKLNANPHPTQATTTSSNHSQITQTKTNGNITKAIAASTKQAPIPEKTESGDSKKSEESLADVPSYNNPRRNQGLLGFIKYFQKGLEEPKLTMSVQISIQIEQFLNDRNLKNNEFQEDGYKADVKKLCIMFLDKDKSINFKNKIFLEYQDKKTGALNCIKDILK